MSQTPQDRPIAPPGWYADARGQLRWLDGGEWTSARIDTGSAVPPGSSQDTGSTDRTWAVLSHLSFFVLPLVAVIVIRLTVGKQAALVRHHSSEALNAQISYAIIWNVLGAIYLTSFLANPQDQPLGVVLTVIALMFLTAAGATVLSIIGAVRASQGRFWRYPLLWRPVRGAVRP